MPAPSGSLLTAQVSSNIGNKSDHADRFISSLCNEISSSWQDWISSMKFGKLQITGSGSPGPWSGVGTTGKLTANKYAFSVDKVFSGAGFTVQTPGTTKMLLTLDEVMGKKFDAWVSSYKFLTVPYAGTYPGIGTNIPGNLLLYGKGINPSGIKSAWESRLEDGDIVKFNLSHPECRTRIFTEAVASAVESQFLGLFLSTTTVTTNTVVTNVTATSLLNGKLL